MSQFRFHERFQARIKRKEERKIGILPKNSLTMAAEPRKVMMSLATVLEAIFFLV